MKKFIFTLLICFGFINGVYAEEKVVIYSDVFEHNNIYYFQNYESINSIYSDVFYNLYSDSLSLYNDKYSNDYPYYMIQYSITSSKSESIEDINSFFIIFNMYKSIPSFNQLFISPQVENSLDFGQFIISYDVDDKDYITYDNTSNGYSIFTEIDSNIYFSPLAYFESNFELVNETGYDIIINKDGTHYFTYKNEDIISSYMISNYITVNLDNYEYVMLSLKDYSKSDAFETNLKVKGMIGITPVYEFGTVEKSEITDRCNVSYSEYTDYRFFILKNDLINNAVYAVKGCEENSSFQFDSTIFDITYVTADNVDDPVITVGGQEYHTIPFNQLTNSANKNEEEGYIPGESESFGSGSSLLDILNNLLDTLSDIWNTFLTFMGFVNKVFNLLPTEIRAICVLTFSTGCILGLIKIIKS